MSELQNPLFEEEKEFLERKKLEYERALRGDVDHIKDQSVMVGKVALVGAGLAGGIWLVSKLFGGKKRKRRKRAEYDEYNDDEQDDAYGYGFGADADHYAPEQPEDEDDYYDDGLAHKSAAESAQAFTSHAGQASEHDEAAADSAARTYPGAPADEDELDDSATGELEEDPFQDLPYDDSRRLPTSHAFDDAARPTPVASSSRSHLLGSVLQAFLQSDTGKVLVAQAAAVVMALVTKKLGEFFPADKNADLATSPGYAPAEAGAVPVASPAPSVPSDASIPSQSV